MVAQNVDCFAGVPPGGGCIGGTIEMTFCINPRLAEAIISASIESFSSDEEGFTVTEIVEDAFANFLRSVGRLPKPYV
jgi:hypothetical protein